MTATAGAPVTTPAVPDVAQETLARISAIYRVPAYVGAPVEFERVRGKVVGADPVSERVWVHLRGRPYADLFHPRSRLIWLEENGPATAVPRFPARPGSPLLTWTEGEGQWSGI